MAVLVVFFGERLDVDAEKGMKYDAIISSGVRSFVRTYVRFVRLSVPE